MRNEIKHRLCIIIVTACCGNEKSLIRRIISKTRGSLSVWIYPCGISLVRVNMRSFAEENSRERVSGPGLQNKSPT